jgi:hypothetical protein
MGQTYTPIFDGIAKLRETNLSDTAVFGAVWRYAKGKYKRCTASPESIAKRIGVTHNTVRTSLKKLVSLELIYDLTPTTTHKPHEYIPTEYALALIAKEVDEEEKEPEKVTKDRLPEFGNLDDEGYQELVGGLPEFGNLGYQNLKDRLPEFGNKDTKKIQEREKEETSTHPLNADYLTDVFSKQGEVSETTGNNPEDQYWNYRDEFLNTYQEMTGAYPDSVTKSEIIRLAETGKITPKMWRESWRQTKINWTGNGKIPLARVIEVCEQGGGDYEKWRSWKYPTNGQHQTDLPKPKIEIVPVKRDD